MAKSALDRIVSHPEKNSIVSDLIMGRTPKEINEMLSQKYAEIDKNLIVSIQSLKKFQEDYLDLYVKIQSDALEVHKSFINETPDISKSIDAQAKELVENNDFYRQKLAEHLNKEIDIKNTVQNLCIIIEDRIATLYNRMQFEKQNTKLDYILIQYLSALTLACEKLNTLNNGSADKIIQQNNINITLLDNYAGVFQKVIRDVIARLDYDTSLLFTEILNEELSKLKPINTSMAPVELRLSEAKSLEDQVSKLDLAGI